MKNISNTLVAFRAPSPLKEAMENFAEREMVSVSALTRTAIAAHLQKLHHKYHQTERPNHWSV